MCVSVGCFQQEEAEEEEPRSRGQEDASCSTVDHQAEAPSPPTILGVPHAELRVGEHDPALRRLPSRRRGRAPRVHIVDVQEPRTRRGARSLPRLLSQPASGLCRHSRSTWSGEGQQLLRLPSTHRGQAAVQLLSAASAGRRRCEAATACPRAAARPKAMPAMRRRRLHPQLYARPGGSWAWCAH